MVAEKLKKLKTRKPVATKPGKVIPSKKEVLSKKRFRKPDWKKETSK